MESGESKVSPVIVAIASIILPGMGYLLLGQKWRAFFAGGGIITLFLLGIFFAGIRVINLPGYQDGYLSYVEARRVGEMVHLVPTTQPIVEVREAGRDLAGRAQYAIKRKVPGGVREEITTERPMGHRWVMLYSPMSVLGGNLWFLGQILTGPICLVAGYLSNLAAQAGVAKSYARLADIGALYTAVAGMLNLLVIIDATSRASGKAVRR